jgi:hypothetical protein
MIENHHVFFNNSNSPQFDPRLKILIVLYRFGAHGNGTSQSNVSSTFQISRGIVGKFTKRVIVALIEILEQRVIEWPNAARKETIKQAIAEEHGFQDAIGMIDGTHIILVSRPNRQGEGYFNRKSRYSIQCMIVNDDKCCILHILAGFIGASHDTRVFMNSDIWLKYFDYFSRREYLLANTGYSLTQITMAPYKKPATNDPANKRFNRWLSFICVRAEHTIRQLKGRFQSLRGLPTVISLPQDPQFVVCWICTCVILHYLFLENGYTYEIFQQDPDMVND